MCQHGLSLGKIAYVTETTCTYPVLNIHVVQHLLHIIGDVYLTVVKYLNGLNVIAADDYCVFLLKSRDNASF